MAYDANNIFAKILRSELPSHKLYEDEHTLSFLDIMPQSHGHTLVVPKEPAVILTDLSAESLQHTIVIVQRLSKIIPKLVGTEAFMIGQFNGTDAGQTVPHVHFHIIPRFPNQPLRGHAQETADPEQLAELATKIRAALAV